jgi:hypothetical protein
MVAAAALLPFVSMAPAYAAANVICVGSPTGGCDGHAASISAALIAAEANAVTDTVLVGPGTYTDGPYFLGDTVTLRGSGQGATILTLPASASDDEYVLANGGTVMDLTVKMAAADSGKDAGLAMWNTATAIRVTVDGRGTEAAAGIEAMNSSILGSDIKMTNGSSTRGLFSEGGVTAQDTSIVGHIAYGMSSPSAADTLSRLTIKTGGTGVGVDVGTVNLDDVLINLGSGSGTGLVAANFNASTAAKVINANHVTIVGGGQNSQGALAYAANPNALQVSTIQLTNSIIRGPQTSLSVMAGNNGAQGGPSTATITASYSNWSSKSETSMANGSAHVVQGAGNVNLDPRFVDAAGGNYRLKAGSPLVDAGDAIAGGPTTDRDGNARIFDGDKDGTAVRDMGAHEMNDVVAPQTKLISTPPKTVTKGSVRFRFKANETGATFQCKIDKKAWRPCTSPKKVKVKVGKHVFKVRATDLSGNTDATPAKYRFQRR